MLRNWEGEAPMTEFDIVAVQQATSELVCESTNEAGECGSVRERRYRIGDEARVEAGIVAREIQSLWRWIDGAMFDGWKC